MERAEYDACRAQHKRTAMSFRWSLLMLAVAVGYGISLVSTLLVGAVVALALVVCLLRLLGVWSRSRWLTRFPELVDNPNVKWVDEQS